ncbi:hypothetical protein K490DRAFT_56755 [Saccharata proteae CBS 121410]|uniref:Uncharacterized protein n=1 Tax=Saccharata proteae CBS 121410 TaxID=1314787 RepID=A0A9P4LX21_9PEZI|nr:hypothetical protein K490DRAFT_56755 [Saccharata proteae CBS 121410]
MTNVAAAHSFPVSSTRTTAMISPNSLLGLALTAKEESVHDSNAFRPDPKDKPNSTGAPMPLTEAAPTPYKSRRTMSRGAALDKLGDHPTIPLCDYGYLKAVKIMEEQCANPIPVTQIQVVGSVIGPVQLKKLRLRSIRRINRRASSGNSLDQTTGFEFVSGEPGGGVTPAKKFALGRRRRRQTKVTSGKSIGLAKLAEKGQGRHQDLDNECTASPPNAYDTLVSDNQLRNLASLNAAETAATATTTAGLAANNGPAQHASLHVRWATTNRREGEQHPYEPEPATTTEKLHNDGSKKRGARLIRHKVSNMFLRAVKSTESLKQKIFGRFLSGRIVRKGMFRDLVESRREELSTIFFVIHITCHKNLTPPVTLQQVVRLTGKASYTRLVRLELMFMTEKLAYSRTEISMASETLKALTIE